MRNVSWYKANELTENRMFDIQHNVNEGRYDMGIFHVHDHYEFYIYITGTIDIAVEEKLYSPEPYTLFVYPPGLMHRCADRGNTGRYERLFCYVSRETIQSMSSPDFAMLDIIASAMETHTYSFRLGPQKGTQLVALADDIRRYIDSDVPANVLLNRCRLNMFLVELCALIDRGDSATHTVPSQMYEIITYINEHLTEPLSVETLAERFHISKYYLLHAFKDYANMSVYQYIISKRLIHAQFLMRDGTPPGIAARACGFNDYAGFYRSFVRRTGVKPQEYWSGKK